MNLFNRNRGGIETPTPTRVTVVPRYQVRETENAYIITAQVPGVDRSAVETTVEGEHLTVFASRAAAKSEDLIALHRESSDADYRLVLELDHRVNREAVTAELNQGVLTLTVSKAETLKPRRIEISG